MRSILLLTLGATIPFAVASAQGAPSLQVAVDKALKPSAFNEVRASVQGDVVTLTGSVQVYRAKLEAEVRAGRVPGVHAVQNRIEVAGPPVSDADLLAELQRHVHTKEISVDVRDGIVALRGQGLDPRLAFAAVTAAAKTPGVLGIVDAMTTTRQVAKGPEVGPLLYTVSSLP